MRDIRADPALLERLRQAYSFLQDPMLGEAIAEIERLDRALAQRAASKSVSEE